MKETFARIAGEDRTYTGREYFGLDQGYYLSKMRVNEEVAVSGLVIQDERSNILTSQYIGSGVTTLKAGQVITFKRPVYRVYAATGSFTFFLTPTQRYGVSSPPTAKESYFDSFPAWLPFKYSLAFDAEKAEDLSDYDTNILYFRDSSFNRVAATFSRTSSATRVNKQGLIETVATGIPRIDYTDGSAKLLMEPARTNTILRSNEFDSPTWNKFAGGTGVAPVVTPNAGISPDGTNNAYRVFFDAGNGGAISDFSILDQPQAETTGTDYTISFWAKSYTNTNQQIRIRYSSAPRITITITPEWQRFTYTITAALTAPNRGTGLDLRGDTASTCDILLYGFQKETASYPTSYIPTAGSAVTRNADDLALTGIASKIGQSSGSVYFSGLSRSSANGYFSLSDGTVTNRVQVDVGSPANTITYRVLVSGTTSANETMPFATNTNYKFGVRYSVDDFAFYANGIKEGQDNLGNTFGANVLTNFYFSAGNAAADLYGTIDKAIIFPTALTDSELQQITS